MKIKGVEVLEKNITYYTKSEKKFDKKFFAIMISIVSVLVWICIICVNLLVPEISIAASMIYYLIFMALSTLLLFDVSHFWSETPTDRILHYKYKIKITDEASFKEINKYFFAIEKSPTEENVWMVKSFEEIE